MPDTKKEMKSKHIPGVCTKDRAVSSRLPREDLITAWPKTSKMFICIPKALKIYVTVNQAIVYSDVLLSFKVLFSELVEARKIFAKVQFFKFSFRSHWP